MSFSGSIQFSLLAEGLFELLGPILIFGIYIIASIVKTVAKKGQKDGSDEEPESELKKAVRRRYQEIYQKQAGKAPQKTSQSRPVQKPEPAMPRQRSQWEIQQEAIRQRNAKLQSQRTVPKRPQVNVPKQVLTAISQPKKKTGNLLSMLKGPKNLRSAIILKEILDKPLALRDV